MKTKAYFLALLLPSLALQPAAMGQNLVPNSSFEILTDCDFGADYADAIGWEHPVCSASPTLLHECNDPDYSYIGIPSNDFGFEYPHSGLGMAKFSTYLNSLGINPRSYLSIDLVESLTAGQEYCIRLWLSLADSASFRSNSLHAFLWYGLPTMCAQQDTAWDTYAAVTFDISTVDTSGWEMVEGSFTASGGESNLTIGNFHIGAEMDTTFIAWQQAGYYAGYLIDDIYLGSCDVGVEEADSDEEIRLWPNPASDVVSITIPADFVGSELQIMDALGRNVLRAMLDEPVNSIDVAGLSDGLYQAWIEGSGMRLAVAFTVDH